MCPGRAACGDCRTLLTGTYDRVVMGHFDALNFLPAVFPHVAGRERRPRP